MDAKKPERRRPSAVTRQTKWGWTCTEENENPKYALSFVGPHEARILITESYDDDRLCEIAEALREKFGWPFAEKRN
jgi:hypothetical protein